MKKKITLRYAKVNICMWSEFNFDMFLDEGDMIPIVYLIHINGFLKR